MTTPSRLSAADALHDVFAAGNRVREGWNRGLSPEEAGLAQAILGLCLRRWGRLGAWCAPRLKMAKKSLPVETRIALGMGLAQLAWLPGVAAHAAVDESVRLVSREAGGFPPHRGLVNSLLRQAAHDRSLLASQLDAMPSSLDRPPFASRLLEHALLGRDTAEGGPSAANVAKIPNTAPPADIDALWARLQKPPTPFFVALRGEPPDGLVPAPGFPAALRLRPGAPFPRAWLESGDGMVQDISSQALMAFDCPPFATHPAPPEGAGRMRVLDVCAAPGGKTTSLALRFPDAAIFALESDPLRAKRLRHNLCARKIDVDLEEADAIEWLSSGRSLFDLILVDAPCSASGTIQKHPELVWVFSTAELSRLRRIQEGLLDAAVPRLRPRGLLIYSVCSWFPAEGLGHLTYLAKKHPGLKPAPIWPVGVIHRHVQEGQGRQSQPGGLTHVFRPDPLTWEGEGFQAFALTV